MIYKEKCKAKGPQLTTFSLFFYSIHSAEQRGRTIYTTTNVTHAENMTGLHIHQHYTATCMFRQLVLPQQLNFYSAIFHYSLDNGPLLLVNLKGVTQTAPCTNGMRSIIQEKKKRKFKD